MEDLVYGLSFISLVPTAGYSDDLKIDPHFDKVFRKSQAKFKQFLLVGRISELLETLKRGASLGAAGPRTPRTCRAMLGAPNSLPAMSLRQLGDARLLVGACFLRH